MMNIKKIIKYFVLDVGRRTDVLDLAGETFVYICDFVVIKCLHFIQVHMLIEEPLHIDSDFIYFSS